MEVAPVRRQKGSLVIILQADLTFAQGSAELTPRGRATVARISSILRKEAGYELDILGHTDTTPVLPGSRWHSNLELSLARASAVFTSLAEHGISPARLKVQGLGALYPLEDNTGGMPLLNSRRVELVLKPAGHLPVARGRL